MYIRCRRAPESRKLIHICDLLPLLGIRPYSKNEELSNLVYGSIDLLENSSVGLPPSFTILSSRTYANILHRNSSTETRILPQQFLISLAYKPNNNTVLRLVSVHVSSAVRNDSNTSSENSRNSTKDFDSPPTGVSTDNTSLPEDPDHQPYSSIVLSSTVTYLQRNRRYFDLWSNLSHDSYHSLTLIVTNGQLSTCLDGEFRPAEPLVKLWDVDSVHRPVEVVFSTHLSDVATVVSYVLSLQIVTTVHGILFYAKTCFATTVTSGCTVWSESASFGQQHISLRLSLFNGLPLL